MAAGGRKDGLFRAVGLQAMGQDKSPWVTGLSRSIAGAASRHCVPDARRCFARVLVLPHPQRQPPGGSQAFVSVTITPLIALDLGSPEFSIALGPRCVLRASVPEAPVHEDSDLRPSEQDVGFPPDSFQRFAMHSVPKSCRMQSSAKRHLDFGVPAPLPAHPRTDLRGCVHRWPRPSLIRSVRCRFARRLRRGTRHTSAPTRTSKPPPAAVAMPLPFLSPPASSRTGGGGSGRSGRRVPMLRRPRRKGPCP